MTLIYFTVVAIPNTQIPSRERCFFPPDRVQPETHRLKSDGFDGDMLVLRRVQYTAPSLTAASPKNGAGTKFGISGRPEKVPFSRWTSREKRLKGWRGSSFSKNPPLDTQPGQDGAKVLMKFYMSFSMDINLTSLRLTASLPLKMDGWKTIRRPFWRNLGLFSGAKMLLLGERTCCHSQIHVPKTSTWRLVVLIVEC